MRDVVFLLCETLRYDHVTPSITPNICDYGKKGVFFTNCLTGNTDTEKSLPWILSGGEIYSPRTNIMSDLRELGYRSYLIHTNPVLLPFQHGWDGVHYCKPDDSGLIHELRNIYHKYPFVRPMYTLLKKFVTLLGPGSHGNFFHRCAYLGYARAEELLELTGKILHQDRDYPVFIWTHLMDPHSPYMPRKTTYSLEELEKIHETKPDAGRSRKAGDLKIPEPNLEEVEVWKTLYKQEIYEMDGLIGEFLSTLNGDEIVVITSDHGEEFGEHGGFGHVYGRLIPELQHVPLIVLDGKRTGLYEERFEHKNLGFLIKEIIGWETFTHPTCSTQIRNLGFIDRTVFKTKLNVIKELGQPGKSLDIGCGDKLYTNHLPNAIGIDVYQEFEGIENCPDYFMDARKLEFSDEVFDSVYLLDTLEHIPETNMVLEEVHRVLKPDGVMVIVDPSDKVLFLTRLLALRFKEAVNRNPDHVHHFNKDKLLKITQPLFKLEKTISRGIFTGYKFRKEVKL